jgi:flagellar FliJ protein
MKGFRFRLEPVLTLRVWEEERARAAYGQSLRQEGRFVDALKAVDARIEESVAEWRRESSVQGPASVRTTRLRHLLGLDRERNDTAQKLVTARRIREQKMKVLIDAHQRVRVLEKLRDQRQQAHLAETRRREEKELDEIVSARFQPDL